MTTRSEVPPLGEAGSLGELDKGLAEAVKAFQATGLGIASIEAEPELTQAAKANLEKAAENKAGTAILMEKLAQAQQLADPDVRNAVVRMIEGAIAGEGSPAMALEFAATAINNAITQGTIRLIVDESQDVDKARLAEFIAEQERNLLRLNERSAELFEQLDPYLTDEQRAALDDADQKVATATNDETRLKAEIERAEKRREVATDLAESSNPDLQRLARSAITTADETAEQANSLFEHYQSRGVDRATAERLEAERGDGNSREGGSAAAGAAEATSATGEVELAGLNLTGLENVALAEANTEGEEVGLEALDLTGLGTVAMETSSAEAEVELAALDLAAPAPNRAVQEAELDSFTLS